MLTYVPGCGMMPHMRVSGAIQRRILDLTEVGRCYRVPDFAAHGLNRDSVRKALQRLAAAGRFRRSQAHATNGLVGKPAHVWMRLS